MTLTLDEDLVRDDAEGEYAECIETLQRYVSTTAMAIFDPFAPRVEDPELKFHGVEYERSDG
jgi:hypothetical protein